MATENKFKSLTITVEAERALRAYNGSLTAERKSYQSISSTIKELVENAVKNSGVSNASEK